MKLQAINLTAADNGGIFHPQLRWAIKGITYGTIGAQSLEQR